MSGLKLPEDWEAAGAINPLQLFRQMKIREQLIKERGAKTVATGLWEFL